MDAAGRPEFVPARVVVVTLLPLLVAACGGSTEGDGREPSTGGAASLGGGTGATTLAGAGGQEEGTGCKPVSFEDPVVEAAVRDEVGNAGDPLTAEQVAQVTELAVAGVTSLSGVECLTSLRIVMISDSFVPTFVPLSQCPIDYVAVDYSSAPYEEIGELSALKTLLLTGPEVADIDFVSGLGLLEGLVLHRTTVTDIGPVAGLLRLELFGATESPVSDISALSGLTELRRVYLSGTYISSLAPLDRSPPVLLSGCAEIEVLDTNLDATTLDVTIPHLCELGWYVQWTGSPGDPNAVWCGPDFCPIEQ